MEQSNKIKGLVFFLLFLLSVGPYSYAIDYSNPKDMPTIELLIALHKEMKKNEKSSLTELATVTLEQEATTDYAKKFSDVKTTIHRKMSDINSYILFATTIVTTTTKLKNLIKEYEDFNTVSLNMVKKKPFVSIYYVNVQKKLKDCTDRLVSSFAKFEIGDALNLLTASMDEKFKLLYSIDSTIEQMKYMLHVATNYIKYASNSSFMAKSIKEMFPEEFKAKTAKKLVEQWNQSKGL